MQLSVTAHCDAQSIKKALARRGRFYGRAGTTAWRRRGETHLLARRRVANPHVGAALRFRDQHDILTRRDPCDRQLHRHRATIDFDVAEECVVFMLSGRKRRGSKSGRRRGQCEMQFVAVQVITGRDVEASLYRIDIDCPCREPKCLLGRSMSIR